MEPAPRLHQELRGQAPGLRVPDGCGVLVRLLLTCRCGARRLRNLVCVCTACRFAEGDSFIICFATAEAAVKFCMEAQVRRHIGNGDAGARVSCHVRIAAQATNQHWCLGCSALPSKPSQKALTDVTWPAALLQHPLCAPVWAKVRRPRQRRASAACLHAPSPSQHASCHLAPYAQRQRPVASKPASRRSTNVNVAATAPQPSIAPVDAALPLSPAYMPTPAASPGSRTLVLPPSNPDSGAQQQTPPPAAFGPASQVLSARSSVLSRLGSVFVTSSRSSRGSPATAVTTATTGSHASGGSRGVAGAGLGGPLPSRRSKPMTWRRSVDEHSLAWAASAAAATPGILEAVLVRSSDSGAQPDAAHADASGHGSGALPSPHFYLPASGASAPRVPTDNNHGVATAATALGRAADGDEDLEDDVAMPMPPNRASFDPGVQRVLASNASEAGPSGGAWPRQALARAFQSQGGASLSALPNAIASFMRKSLHIKGRQDAGGKEQHEEEEEELDLTRMPEPRNGDDEELGAAPWLAQGTQGERHSEFPSSGRELTLLPALTARHSQHDRHAPPQAWTRSGKSASWACRLVRGPASWRAT